MLRNTQFLFAFGESSTGNEPGEFKEPVSVATTSTQNVVVTDRGNNRIQVFNSEGTFLFEFGSEGFGDGEFNRPSDLAVDKDDRIIVADGGNSRIQVLIRRENSCLSSVPRVQEMGNLVY